MFCSKAHSTLTKDESYYPQMLLNIQVQLQIHWKRKEKWLGILLKRYKFFVAVLVNPMKKK